MENEDTGIMTLSKHGFLHGGNAIPEPFRAEHEDAVRRFDRVVTQYIDARAEIGRDRKLTEEGQRDAQRELAEKVTAGLQKDPAVTTWRRLRKQVTYQSEHVAKLAAPRPPDGMSEAQITAHDMEVRAFLRGLSDQSSYTADGVRYSERSKVLMEAVDRGDGAFLRAVTSGPAGLPLFMEADLEVASERYMDAAIKNLPPERTKPLADTKEAYAAFEMTIRALERAVGAKFDAPEPTIREV